MRSTQGRVTPPLPELAEALLADADAGVILIDPRDRVASLNAAGGRMLELKVDSYSTEAGRAGQPPEFGPGRSPQPAEEPRRGRGGKANDIRGRMPWESVS